MTILQQAMIVVSGVIYAVLADIRTWRQHPGEKYDWWLAASRWLEGLIAGLTVAVGVEASG